jgi:Ran GTPase-activating protein (RanGAP) involved in mRNA processing and transport
MSLAKGSNLSTFLLTKLKENTSALGGMHNLDVSSSTVGPREMTVLGDTIRQNGNSSEGMAPLISIDLSHNRICGVSQTGKGTHDTDGLSDFLSSLTSLSKISRLRTLNLSKNNLNVKAFGLIGNFIASSPPALVEVRLRSCEGSPEAIEKLMEGIKTSKSLQTLDIAGNDVGVKGAMCIAEVLVSPTRLKQLDISSCHLGAEGSDTIFQAMNVNASVEVLSVSENAIGDLGCEAVAMMLKSNSKLKHLDLQENHIGIEGIAAIAKALTKNRVLIFLGLQWNDLSNDAAARIGEAMTQNNTLKAIHLLGNHIDLDGIKMIINGNMTCTDRPIDLDLGFCYRPAKAKTERKVIKEAVEDDPDSAVDDPTYT